MHCYANNGAVSRLQGVRSPLWPTWFPVYASVVSFGVFTSYTSANTRYGWLVRPYSTGIFTLQETPSLLGALTVWLSDSGGADKATHHHRAISGKTRRFAVGATV